ncbi:MAG: hypothetical protein KDC02_24380 [Flavobacteriales bacterium]|nr:hypothetical protein [Flavobacteriales bacterium]
MAASLICLSITSYMHAQVTPAQPQPTVVVSGDFDSPSGHPECEGEEGAERERCTAEVVLREVKARIPEAPAGWESYEDMGIRFDVNAFGNITGIVVESMEDQVIHQAVVTTLYALPKFIPARKDGKGMGSRYELRYPMRLVFGE